MKHETVPIDLSNLDFDDENPRLSLQLSSEDKFGEDAIINFLNEESDLSELTTSMFKNGYLDFEPLIVLKNDNKYVVLEGNRRLAALKLMNNPALRRKMGIQLNQTEIDEHGNLPDTINCYIVKSREEAKPLIGFKHIRGAFKWTSYAKAKFLTESYKKEYEKDNDRQDIILEIANEIGDTNSTVKNLIAGMLVLEQAEKEGLFRVSDKNKAGQFGFSHLYTALNRSEYQEYLGIDSGWNKSPSLNPIKNEYLDNLKEVLHFIYGSKSANVDSVIKSQNPDIKKLGEILLCTDGLNDLRSGSTIDDAYEYLMTDEAVFDLSIRSALSSVNNALSKVSRFDGNDSTAVEITEKIFKSARALRNEVELEFKEKNPSE